ncbi:MAG TPA: hypothetical protein VFS39_02400 [Nitrospira sp.]|nr:hypothetical protein [Nitrospira sp.]
MNPIRKDVRDLITLNEKIQSALMQGESLTHDEATIIRMCAAELLSRVPDGHVSQGPAAQSHNR